MIILSRRLITFVTYNNLGMNTVCERENGGPGNGGMLQPGQVIRPLVEMSQVPELVKRIFGLSTTSIKELNSYDDKNFHIQVSASADNPHVAGSMSPSGYVLKILNSMDSHNEGLVAGQNHMMLFLASHGFKVPCPVRNKAGTYMSLTRIQLKQDSSLENSVSEEEKNCQHMVRLLTFLPGKTLNEVLYTPSLFYQSGVFIARMDHHLKDFHNEDLKSRQLIWMLENTPQLSQFMHVVLEPDNRKLIMEVLEAWQKVVVPFLPRLEKGYIHGDFNEQNIIVDNAPDDPTNHQVQGLLDFGDVQFSCYVFELAITIMYQMIEVKLMPPGDAGGHTLAGYLTIRDVPQLEWDVLKECVAARFAQSLVLGAYSHQLDPSNQYLLTTAHKGWTVLNQFWNTPKQNVLARWKEIAQSYQK